MASGRIRIKMCGMTRSEDIAEAALLGVDAVGLIFYPKSPRYVSISDAKRLLASCPVFVDAVAVMVNPDDAMVRQVLDELPIQWLQFHGSESGQFCAQFKKPYIKAVSVSHPMVVNDAIREHPEASAFLLDTPSTYHGGTGQCFDWRLVPHDTRKPLILAGGLNANNIIEAVRMAKPFAVDVCSGIERTQGIKDHQKMRQLIMTLRENYDTERTSR